MIKSLPMAKAIAEYLKLDRNDNSIIDFYSQYEDTFNNIEKFADEIEFLSYVKICYEYAVALMNKHAFEKAINVFNKLIKIIKTNDYKKPEKYFLYCVLYLSQCNYILKKYNESNRNILSNLDIKTVSNNYDVINLLKNIKLIKLKKYEILVCVIFMLCIFLNSTFGVSPFVSYLRIANYIFIILSAFVLYIQYNKLEKLAITDYFTKKPLGIAIWVTIFLGFIVYFIWPYKVNANIGNYFRDFGAYDISVDWLTKSIENKQDYALAFNSRGVTRYYQGKFDLAVDDYNRAIKLNPEHALAIKNRGLVFLALGKPEQAKKDYEDACNLGRCEDFTRRCSHLKDRCEDGECVSIQTAIIAGLCR